MDQKLTVRDITVRRQNVLVRTDYNVPLKNGEITDDLRIRASLPTLELLRKKGARRIIIMSHLGRPHGQRVPELSLKPAAARLAELLPEAKVSFIGDVSGPDVEEAVEKTPVGGILVLENLRFFKGEEEDSLEFAREIAECTHADLFVQDGFAVVHRAHASTDAITREVPSVGGLLLEKELSALSKLTRNPAHPFALVLGGAKVSDKQPLIDRFIKRADNIIVGGKIAADGYQPPEPSKDSAIASNNTAIASAEAASASKSSVIANPRFADIYVAEDFSDDTKRDLGAASTARILEILERAKTVLWNGALGMTEDPEYARSSTAIAELLGRSREKVSIICGGDTTGFIKNLQKSDPSLEYTLVSTGGGAALEFLSGLPLPGVESLDDR